jgi:hypothetical protein
MRTILLCLLFSFYLATYAQEKPIVIPFELTKHNVISVPFILNGKDTVHLMFHTAAGSVTLIEESIKKLTGLRFNGTDTVNSWGGGGNASRFSTGNSLQTGGLTWEQVQIGENKNSGFGTDGKFGPHLFKDKVIEIDFDKKRIVLHNSLPAKTKRYTKLRATFQQDNLFVEALCNTGGDTTRNRFLLHSGYSGSILFDDRFAADHKLSEKLKVIDTKEARDSYNNVVKIQTAILPGFTLGNTTLPNVPAGFFDGAIGRQKMSAIGTDLLKRFNIIIDAQRTFVYLQPNKSRKSPYYPS